MTRRQLNGITLATAVGLVVLAAASRPALPDGVAIHWGLGGRPNGFVSRTDAVLLLCLPVVALALAAVLAGRGAGRLGGRWQASLSAMCVFIASASAMVLLVNLTGSPERPLPLWGLAILVVGGVIYWPILLGARITDTDPAVRLLLRRRAKASVGWSWTQSSRWARPWSRALLLAALAAAVVGILATVAGSPTLTLLCLLIAAGLMSCGLTCYAFVSITLRVDPGAVTISYGGRLQWPVTCIPLSAVGRVDVVDLIPQRHGGWGYRGGIKDLGHASVILGRGPGLRFLLRDETVFCVSLDDAEAAKRAIDSLLPDPGEDGASSLDSDHKLARTP